MKLNRKSKLVALIVALMLAITVSAQEQQVPKNEAPPDASPPQTQNSQNPSAEPVKPPAEHQSSEPQAGQEQKSAPENTPAALPKEPPAANPQCPGKPHAPSHSKSAKRGKHKEQVTAKQPVAHEPGTDASGQPGKVVVRNGGTKDGPVQLSPGGSQEQELHNRENTIQLLATTDQNLRMLAGRQLSSSEQSTVDQIQSYVRQAKAASDAGDLARAHTLAFKAHLLSDDLAKHY